MNQSAQCLNCETIFDTPGVAVGKTAIVLCPRCKKAVVVKGEVDPADVAPTGPVGSVPDRTGPVSIDRTAPLPRPVPDRTGPIAIPGTGNSFPGTGTSPLRTGPVPGTAVAKERIKEEDSHAWRTRPVSERSAVEREKKVQESAPPPPVAVDRASTGKLVAMGLFTVACIAFTLVRVFYQPAPDTQTMARIEANENAFKGVVPFTEDGVSVAVISDAYARALEAAPERDICVNAIFQGVMATKIRTETGKPVADCSALLQHRR